MEDRPRPLPPKHTCIKTVPNICTNHLTITNVTEEQAEFISKAFADKNFPNAFVPEPDWESTPNESGETPTRDEHGSLRFPDGTSDGRWRDWRYTHWGDKWVARTDGTPEKAIKLDDGDLTIRFQTAWGPYGKGVWEGVSRFAPDACVVVKYDEAGADVYGVIAAKDGVCVDEDRPISELKDKLLETEAALQQLKDFTKDVDPDDEDAMWEAVGEWWWIRGGDAIDCAQDDLAVDLEARIQDR